MYLDMNTIPIEFSSGKEVNLMRMRLIKKSLMLKNLLIESWSPIGDARILKVNSILSFRMNNMEMKVKNSMNISDMAWDGIQ